MKVNTSLLKEFAKNEEVRDFGYKNIKYSNCLPLCRWDKNDFQEKVYRERHYKIIKTRGKIVKKVIYRIRTKEKVIFGKWKFNFLPEKYKISDGWLLTKIPKNTICLSFKTAVNKWDSFIIPTGLNLSEQDLIAIGLLKGEMISSTRGKSKHYVSFTNSDPELIKIVMNFLKKIKMNDFISFQVIANIKEERLQNDDYIKYWSSYLRIPDKKFVRTFRDKRYKTKNIHGALSLKIYNTPFRCFIQFLVNDIKDFTKEDCINFLKGLFAAEGNVNLSYNDSLNFVALGCSKQKDIEMYKILLKRVGIKCGGVIQPVSNDDANLKGWKKGTGGFMMIQGFDNFQKIYQYDLLNISKNKKIKFLQGLKNHRTAQKSDIYNEILKDLNKFGDVTNILNKNHNLTSYQKKIIEIIIQKGGSVTISELAKILKIHNSSSSRILNGISSKGKLVKHGKKRITFTVQ